MPEQRTKIHGWYAKRAGGRITLHGFNEADQPVKVPRIDTIRSRDGTVIATRDDLTEYELI